MIKFTILGEACSKANSRRLVNFGKRPAIIKSQKAIDYARTAQLQIPHEFRLMIEGPVRVTMRVFYSSQRPDLDESVILDSLQAQYKSVKGPLLRVSPGVYKHGESERKIVSRGVYKNDRQVREKHIFWGLDKNNPRTEIEIEELTPEEILAMQASDEQLRFDLTESVVDEADPF